jgi:hypothetical protein
MVFIIYIHFLPFIQFLLNFIQLTVNLQRYELKDVILAAGALTQEICSIIIFIMVFVYLDSGRPQLSITICMAIAIITLFLYSTLIFVSPTNDGINYAIIYPFISFKTNFHFSDQ